MPCQKYIFDNLVLNNIVSPIKIQEEEIDKKNRQRAKF